MLRILNRALLFILLLTAAGCSCSDTTDKDRVAILIPSDILRFKNVAKVFASKMNEAGYQCDIYNAANSEALQMEHARRAIASGVRCACISAVNANTAAAIVRLFEEAGIPVMAYNRLINNCHLNCFVAGDVKGLAEMMVRTAIEAKPNGYYYIIGGDRYDINGHALRQATDSLLAPYEERGDITVVYRCYTENWDPAVAAEQFVQAVNLSGRKPDAVLAGYDAMSRSIIGAIEEIYGSTDGIVVTGQDAELASVRMIVEGRQTMTAYHRQAIEADMAAQAAAALAAGRKPKDIITGTTFNGMEEVPTISVTSQLITQDNVNEEIIKRGIYKAEDVYDTGGF